MKEQQETNNDEPTRRTFIKGRAGALVAASCLTALGSRARTAGGKHESRFGGRNLHLSAMWAAL